MMTETKSKLEKIREDLVLNRRLTAFDYDKIRSNEDLSDSAKLRKLEEVYREGKQKHERLRQEAEAERAKVKEEARQKLYSAPIPKSSWR
jgi:hypothetical protein